MRGRWLSLLGGLVMATFGCAGGTPNAEEPTDEYGVPLVDREDEEDYDDVDQPAVTERDTEESDEAAGKKQTVPEPQFEPGMSVSQAINAVPQGTDRVNIEDEILARPLMDPKVYEPCKPGAKHFTIKVAIWNGRAVGIDIDAKDQKLAQCIRQQIEGLTWREKAKSLNTVEYSF